MTATHHFNNENDLSQGGVWFDDLGRHICKWSWRHENRALTIQARNVSRDVDLRNFAEISFSQDVLRDRLPKIALHEAEDIILRGRQ